MPVEWRPDLCRGRGHGSCRAAQRRSAAPVPGPSPRPCLMEGAGVLQRTPGEAERPGSRWSPLGQPWQPAAHPPGPAPHLLLEMTSHGHPATPAYPMLPPVAPCHGGVARLRAFTAAS